ncbi:hypothetical protein ONS96_008422 [Cadophora gregata f. sp. sojae]|nr:hypothetical protein ONS96_008422 [Cadophora gregata f. sp. sojae]
MAEIVRSASWKQDVIRRLATDDADILQFCRLLAHIDSPSVPKALFDRACRSRLLWTDSGELNLFPPRHSKVPSWLVRQFGTTIAWESPPILPQAINIGLVSTSKNGLLEYLHLNDEWRTELRAGLHQATSLEHLYDVLAVVIHAFPEQHAEILWEEMEEHLWDVVNSTILPFLTVLNPVDVMAHLSSAGDTSGQPECFHVFLRFLSRIFNILGENCPLSVLTLHEHCYAYLYAVKEQTIPSQRHELPRHLFFASPVIQKENLSHLHNKEQLDATQLPSSKDSREIQQVALQEVLPSYQLAWAVLVRRNPSCTLEILARAILEGVASVQKLLRLFPPRMHPQLGFLAARQQSFEIACVLLESSLGHVKKDFGVVSMEYLITGIELVKCYNFLMEEVDGEKMAQTLWNKVFQGEPKVTSHHQGYLAIVLSDSFIGQAKYEEAENILSSVLDYAGVSSDMIVSTSVRLLKMSRRQRKESPRFDIWKLLNQAVRFIEEISDELLFDLVEEAMCHISVLDDDPAQLPRAEAVMTSLGRISLEHYSGPETSKRTLLNHIAALQRYEQDFKLFTVTGPQLHFSRLIRDGFPNASVSLIERIGTANWNRFNRVKELPLRASVSTEDACSMDGRTLAGKSEGTFVDSALGSSLQTASRRARSQISWHSVGSAIAGSLENFPPLPIESSKGKTFECPICCKRLRGIVSATQWERHVYADLQPYVCILDRCSSNMTAFGSRLEFTNHMFQHQDTIIWSCAACGDAQDDLDTTRKHISHAHPEMNVESAVVSETFRRDMAKEQCPFCGTVPGAGFIGHICRHLEEIALTILPKEVEWDSESENNDSSSLSRDSNDDSEFFLQQGAEIWRGELDLVDDKNFWTELETPHMPPINNKSFKTLKVSNKDMDGGIKAGSNSQNEPTLVAMADTGGDMNFISKDFAERHELLVQDGFVRLQVSEPDGTNKVKEQAKAHVASNTAAAVEQDAVNAFKAFAAQQRKNVETARFSRARTENEAAQSSLLTNARKFAEKDTTSTTLPMMGGVKPRIQFGSLTHDGEDDNDDEFDEETVKQFQNSRTMDHKADRSRSPSPIPMMEGGPSYSSPSFVPASSDSSKRSHHPQSTLESHQTQPMMHHLSPTALQERVRIARHYREQYGDRPMTPDTYQIMKKLAREPTSDDDEPFASSQTPRPRPSYPEREPEPAPQPDSPPPEQPTFQLPRKNAAITIKRPDGTPIDLTKAREPPIPGSAEDLEERAAAAEAALICIGCNRQYKSKKKWRKHVASHGRGLFLCRAGCGERFYTLEGRSEHENGHFVTKGERFSVTWEEP